MEDQAFLIIVGYVLLAFAAAGIVAALLAWVSSTIMMWILKFAVELEFTELGLYRIARIAIPIVIFLFPLLVFLRYYPDVKDGGIVYEVIKIGVFIFMFVVWGRTVARTEYGQFVLTVLDDEQSEEDSGST